jgi:hypothetical protein
MGAARTNGLPARHVVARRIDTTPSDGAPVAMADTSETSKIRQDQLRVLVEGSQAIKPILHSELEPQIEMVPNSTTRATMPKITRHANVIRRGEPIAAMKRALPLPAPAEIDDEEAPTTAFTGDVDRILAEGRAAAAARSAAALTGPTAVVVPVTLALPAEGDFAESDFTDAEIAAPPPDLAVRSETSVRSLLAVRSEITSLEVNLESLAAPLPVAPRVAEARAVLPEQAQMHWLRSLVIGATIGLTLIAIAVTVLSLTA